MKRRMMMFCLSLCCLLGLSACSPVSSPVPSPSGAVSPVPGAATPVPTASALPQGSTDPAASTPEPTPVPTIKGAGECVKLRAATEGELAELPAGRVHRLDDSPYSVPLLFTPAAELTDIEFIRLFYDDEVDVPIPEDEPVLRLESLRPEEPAVVWLYTPENFPNMLVTFACEGRLYAGTVTESRKDGSFSLTDMALTGEEIDTDR